jgi:hypothetical protein
MFSVRDMFGGQGYDADLSMRTSRRVPEVLHQDDSGGSLTAMSPATLCHLPHADS